MHKRTWRDYDIVTIHDLVVYKWSEPVTCSMSYHDFLRPGGYGLHFFPRGNIGKLSTKWKFREIYRHSGETRETLTCARNTKPYTYSSTRLPLSSLYRALFSSGLSCSPPPRGFALDLFASIIYGGWLFSTHMRAHTVGGWVGWAGFYLGAPLFAMAAPCFFLVAVLFS